MQIRHGHSFPAASGLYRDAKLTGYVPESTFQCLLQNIPAFDDVDGAF